ncbi:MAG: PAS domain-containing protein [Alphaproteobacteria bacterium]|nr:PAS domain-containing protein [Alphaproteobacteria bacterium]
MNIETITVLIYVCIGITLIFPFVIGLILHRLRCTRRALINQTDWSKLYEEMLYAAQDGYLVNNISKDSTETHCSRRLATLLNLKNGEKSTAAEVFSVFAHKDGEALTAFYKNLTQNGTSFETMAKTKTAKTFAITGVRINSPHMEIDCNCLWFRDITSSAEFIARVTDEAYHCRQKLEDFRILIDHLPCPVWLRNEQQEMLIMNRGYLKLLGLKDFKDITPQNTALHDLGNTTNFTEIAKIARESNTPQKKQINILSDGDLKRFELTETPYYDSSLKTSHTIGSLIDITEFDEAKRNYRVHLDSHLEILSSLDTAFCIINTKHNFTFGNAAFLKLWNLPENFLEQSPHYNAFLDKIREAKVLPEVSDFKAYKEEENKAFDALTEQREDMLYIPDGRTFRRIRAPHPDGTIIAYEDLTDRLDTSRKLGDLLAVQQGLLDNVSDSVLIFSPSLKLKYYNKAYLKLWDSHNSELDKKPHLSDILNQQKNLLPEIEDWQSFRDDMQKHIIACTPFTLKLKNKQRYKVTPVILADTSLMITYHKE